MYVNCIFNKQSEFLPLVQIAAPDLVCFSEILPKDSSYSVEISALQIEGSDCLKKILNIMFIGKL